MWPFSKKRKSRDNTLGWLSHNPAPVASSDLCGAFLYSMASPEIHFHLLLGKGRYLEDSVDDTKVAWSTLADADDKAERLERFYAWVCDIKAFVRGHSKAGEHLVLLAGRTLKDALGMLYDRTFEAPLTDAEIRRYKRSNEKAAENKNGSKVKIEHVILTKCPELTEVLRIARGYNPQQGISYEYDCGCFFIDDELTDMLKACEDFYHNNK